MTKAAICGAAGRMGKTILEVIGETDGITAGAAIEQSGSPALGLDAGEQAGIGRLGVSVTDNIESVIDDFDVLIDFTRADAVLENLEACRAGNKRVVIGTTGLSAEQQQVLHRASEEIAIVFAPNMSVGVNLCFKLAELAASIVGDSTDIEIIEAHHNRKIDAPSGTAVRLGEIVARNWDATWRSAQSTAAKVSPARGIARPSVLRPSAPATSSANTHSCSPVQANGWRSGTSPPAARHSPAARCAPRNGSWTRRKACTACRTCWG